MKINSSPLMFQEGQANLQRRIAAFAARINAHWEVKCFNKHGKLKWKEVFDNLIVNTGLNNMLQEYFKGANYTAAFYVLITNANPTVAAADTMAVHAGWTENEEYNEATRPALTLGAVAGQSVDNSANKAVFTIKTDDQTIGGCCLTTDNTKGGAIGTLIGGGAFTGGNKSDLDTLDTLNVTVTLTQSAS